ncbi:MAG: L,D-transpeptidase [Alphaproteobacteria bacterium]
MDLIVEPAGWALWDRRRMRCALGRGGVRREKVEGDGATPVGRFAILKVLYRPDRLARPSTTLPCSAIREIDGWCDAPADANYNRAVALPYRASAERLWRVDGLYDLLGVMSYNDPPIPGRGSAIFLHVAASGYAATEGCVALALGDLLAVLADADSTTRVVVLEA